MVTPARQLVAKREVDKALMRMPFERRMEYHMIREKEPELYRRLKELFNAGYRGILLQ
jgi:hypothetical protein